MKNGMIVDNRGTKLWYVNDKLHRIDGPASEWADGTKYWYQNGELHREDGPAIERYDGHKSWFVNGMRHREDGPAVISSSGWKEWHLNGVEVTEQDVIKFQQQQQQQHQQLAQETQKKLASHDIDIDPDSVTFDMIEQCDNFKRKSVLIDLYGLDRYWNEKVARKKS